MINVELKSVHVGREIAKRLDELNMTKTEFGKLIGVQQQHVNRILERDTMETKKLYKVCQVLEMNFFALFCKFSTNVNAYLAAVVLGNGDANNNIGEAAILSEIEKLKSDVKHYEESNALLREQIQTLRDNLADKDELIQVYKQSK
ncbi:helix-turn-helix domain-containing protein [Duncaniella muris]|uniref:helix-turn-helix domain-containing protein n=1 Tax=Duncaniella muris TaxID=2094150 RepID=UPI0025B774DB|nr:helix-turn-helix transcriptional regulator [Duncaniella muris]